jgi:hypothetical protein
MNFIRFSIYKFTEILKKHGVVSFVMIAVFMIRFAIYDSEKQLQNSTYGLILGGFIILGITPIELVYRIYI